VIVFFLPAVILGLKSCAALFVIEQQEQAVHVVEPSISILGHSVDYKKLCTQNQSGVFYCQSSMFSRSLLSLLYDHNRPHYGSCPFVSVFLPVCLFRTGSYLENRRHGETEIGVNVFHGRSNLCAIFSSNGQK